MLLNNMSSDEKARAFDMVLEAYGKDSDLSHFGKDVEDIISFLKKYYDFKK